MVHEESFQHGGKNVLPSQNVEKTYDFSFLDTSFMELPDGTEQLPLGSGYITGILGKGGMSIVYEIWNERLGVKRAVKLLRPHSTEEIRKGFDKESKITAQLDHPNIITIHNVGVWNDLPYIEMERVDGFSLSELIREKKTLPMEVCTAIGICISKALVYTHYLEYSIDNIECKGLMHRDLKPGNILISYKGVVRLTDFGIASPTNIELNTPSETIIGSMQYLAPEQLKGNSSDLRTDIFPFGCILFEMITGEKTFPEIQTKKLTINRFKNNFKSLSSFKKNIPHKLTNLITSCLQFDPNNRPDDIQAVLKSLTKIHYSLTSKSPKDILELFIRGHSIKDKKRPITSVFLLTKVAGVLLLAFSVVIGVHYLYTGSLVTLKTNKVFAYVSSITKSSTHTKKTESPLPSHEISNIIETKKTQEEIFGLGNINDSPSGKKIRKQSNKKIKPGDTHQNRRTTNKTKPVTKTLLSKPIHTPPTMKQKNSTIETNTALSTRQDKENDTNDPIVLMRYEDSLKNYLKVLDIYKGLHPIQAKTTEARLLKHRAIVATFTITQFYFDNNEIKEGEFYLSKAQFLYNNEHYTKSLTILDEIKVLPALLIDKNELHRQHLFLTAKCHTAIFNKVPTNDRQKKAMTCWFKVKDELRNDQIHPFLTEANEEIRKISKTQLTAN